MENLSKNNITKKAIESAIISESRGFGEMYKHTCNFILTDYEKFERAHFTIDFDGNFYCEVQYKTGHTYMERIDANNKKEFIDECYDVLKKLA